MFGTVGRALVSSQETGLGRQETVPDHQQKHSNEQIV